MNYQALLSLLTVSAFGTALTSVQAQGVEITIITKECPQNYDPCQIFNDGLSEACEDTRVRDIIIADSYCGRDWDAWCIVKYHDCYEDTPCDEAQVAVIATAAGQNGVNRTQTRNECPPTPFPTPRPTRAPISQTTTAPPTPNPTISQATTPPPSKGMKGGKGTKGTKGMKGKEGSKDGSKGGKAGYVSVGGKGGKSGYYNGQSKNGSKAGSKNGSKSGSKNGSKSGAKGAKSNYSSSYSGSTKTKVFTTTSYETPNKNKEDAVVVQMLTENAQLGFSSSATSKSISVLSLVTIVVVAMLSSF